MDEANAVASRAQQSPAERCARPTIGQLREALRTQPAVAGAWIDAATSRAARSAARELGRSRGLRGETDEIAQENSLRLMRLVRDAGRDDHPLDAVACAIAVRVVKEQRRTRAAQPSSLDDPRRVRTVRALPAARPSLEDRLLHLTGDEAWLTVRDGDAIAVVRAHGVRGAARALGMSGSTLRRRLALIADADPLTGAAPAPPGRHR